MTEPALPRPSPAPEPAHAAASAPPIDAWLRIDDDERIWIRSGKVELGQGVHEALAMIVAEELDVDLGRVRVAPVDTATSRDDGTTAGSRSMQESGAELRIAAASARLALLATAAAQLGVDVHRLTLDDGTVREPGGRSVRFAALARAGALGGAVDPAAPIRPAAARRLVGTSPRRRDLVPKVTGVPTFVQDLDLPGMVHGRVVRPPSYGARLVSVDETEIGSLPGVMGVTRNGDFLGVVAEREDQAIVALRRARRVASWAERDSLPPTADPRYLLAADAEEIVISDRRPDGAGDAAPAAGLRTVAAEYSREHLAHGALGPSCAIAVLSDGQLDVWCHSQGIFRLRGELAIVLGLAEAAIRVRHVEGAGCYGHNGADDVALDAALLARDHPGRPVRVQWMRDDEFAWEPYGPAMVVRMAAEVDATGRIVDWRHDVWGHGHDSRPAAGRPADESALLAARHLAVPYSAPRPRRPRGPGSGGQRNAEPIYRFAGEWVADHHVAEAPLRVSSLRALGAHANVFAIESFMDEIAAAIGADPVELRLRHLDDERARTAIETVVRMAAGTPRLAGDGSDTMVGRGIGFARYKSKMSYAAVIVEVELDTEIRVRRAWGAIDAGMVVSRDGLLNQSEGGIVQATSWTLHEAVRTEGPRIATRAWDTYRTLRFPDVPEVTVELIDRPDEPPLGAGEAFAGPTSAAIANAIANASGVRLRDLPLTADRFVAAVGQGSAGSG
jgi:CO/xanthine dehydrogenase Mo-binding subunit